ncbi:MAG: T9SS type A sorting domain-containing protein, partial [Bacteroidota bacterium]|nr:T9SS type A sorting domain-containing protein [Bacteroidota bacterium]
LVVSNFFGYNPDNGRYETTDTIFSGIGYWVKVNQAGRLILEAGSQKLSKANIIIKPDSDLPPPPPLPLKGEEETKALPEDFALYQNYPNPFNPTTEIMYDIASRSFVSLKIINTLGQVIATLVNEVKQPGRYSAIFNATGLSSGIYLCKIQTESYTETKKIILIK